MDLCTKLCGQLLLYERKKGCGENMVVSPLSFNAILHMIAPGASGSTLKQMLEFLEYKSKDDLVSKFADIMSIAASDGDDEIHGGPVIRCLNAAWADELYPLKASFKDIVERVFKARAVNINVLEPYEVLRETKAWAESATKGLVKNVLKHKHFEPLPRLIIGNALYFKGFWEDSFNHNSTMDKNFYLLSGEKVSVPFMTGCSKYSHGSFDGFELVKIPYRQGKEGGKIFSMYIFLPNENDGLESLLQKAVTDSGFFQQPFQLNDVEYDIFWIPKFKITYNTTEGRKTMIDMGLDLPFDKDYADLSETTEGEEQAYVSTVIQQAFIEIDEGGTEAAAVTFPILRLGASLDYFIPTRFVADHPFMFMIKEEKSRSVLFTGAVLNPLLEEIQTGLYSLLVGICYSH